jgi:hypothetical protein
MKSMAEQRAKPKRRRSFLIERVARCIRCGRPAALQFGLASGGECCCVGCVGTVVRRWKESQVSTPLRPQATRRV